MRREIPNISRSFNAVKDARALKTEAYRAEGFAARFVINPPGQTYTIYTEREVRLFPLFGWAVLRPEGADWQLVAALEEFKLRPDVAYETEVGDNGWGYIRALAPKV